MRLRLKCGSSEKLEDRAESILLEAGYSDDAADDTNVHAKERSTEARSACQQQHAKVVDLWRVDFHGIIADELGEDGIAGAAHDCRRIGTLWLLGCRLMEASMSKIVQTRCQ